MKETGAILVTETELHFAALPTPSSFAIYTLSNKVAWEKEAISTVSCDTTSLSSLNFVYDRALSGAEMPQLAINKKPSPFDIYVTKRLARMNEVFDHLITEAEHGDAEDIWKDTREDKDKGQFERFFGEAPEIDVTENHYTIEDPGLGVMGGQLMYFDTSAVAMAQSGGIHTNMGYYGLFQQERAAYYEEKDYKKRAAVIELTGEIMVSVLSGGAAAAALSTVKALQNSTLSVMTGQAELGSAIGLGMIQAGTGFVSGAGLVGGIGGAALGTLAGGFQIGDDKKLQFGFSGQDWASLGLSIGAAAGGNAIGKYFGGATGGMIGEAVGTYAGNSVTFGDNWEVGYSNEAALHGMVNTYMSGNTGAKNVTNALLTSAFGSGSFDDAYRSSAESWSSVGSYAGNQYRRSNMSEAERAAEDSQEPFGAAMNLFGGIGAWASRSGRGIKESFMEGYNGSGEIASSGSGGGGRGFASFGQNPLSELFGLFGGGGSGGGETMPGIGEMLTSALGLEYASGLVSGIYHGIGNVAQDAWYGAGDLIKKGASATWGGITKGAKATWGGITKGAKATWGGITKGAKATWGGITKGAKATWGGITKGAKATWGGITKGAKATWGGLKKVASAIKSGSSSIWGGIKDFFTADPAMSEADRVAMQKEALALLESGMLDDEGRAALIKHFEDKGYSLVKTKKKYDNSILFEKKDWRGGRVLGLLFGQRTEALEFFEGDNGVVSNDIVYETNILSRLLGGDKTFINGERLENGGAFVRDGNGVLKTIGQKDIKIELEKLAANGDKYGSVGNGMFSSGYSLVKYDEGLNSVITKRQNDGSLVTRDSIAGSFGVYNMSRQLFGLPIGDLWNHARGSEKAIDSWAQVAASGILAPGGYGVVHSQGADLMMAGFKKFYDNPEAYLEPDEFGNYPEPQKINANILLIGGAQKVLPKREMVPNIYSLRNTGIAEPVPDGNGSINPTGGNRNTYYQTSIGGWDTVYQGQSSRGDGRMVHRYTSAEGKKFWGPETPYDTYGGGTSHDFNNYLDGIDWWINEINNGQLGNNYDPPKYPDQFIG